MDGEREMSDARLHAERLKRRLHSLTDEQKLFLDEWVECVEEEIPGLGGNEVLSDGEED